MVTAPAIWSAAADGTLTFVILTWLHAVNSLIMACKVCLHMLSSPPELLWVVAYAISKLQCLLPAIQMPYIFTVMHAKKSPSCLLAGFPDDVNAYAQRDLGHLWNGHVGRLCLHTQSMDLGCKGFSLIKTVGDLWSLSIIGDPGPEEDRGQHSLSYYRALLPGLKDSLEFLDDSEGLQVLHLDHHVGLTDIGALSALYGLEELRLHDTGVRHWPEVLDNLASLTRLQISLPRCVHADKSYSSETESDLYLPSDFFSGLPSLEHLSLQNHRIVLPVPDSFSHLQSLQSLDLTGSDLAIKVEGTLTELWCMLHRRGAVDPDVKPLQGLSNLRHLCLSNFSPYWGARLNFAGLVNLGVTVLSSLKSLDLSNSRLRAPPTDLKWLTWLQHLDLGANLLESNCLTDPAILALSNLRSLNLGSCMTAHFSPKLDAKNDFHQWSRKRAWKKSRTSPADQEQAWMQQLPDCGPLMKACPHLQQLHVCNAA